MQAQPSLIGPYAAAPFPRLRVLLPFYEERVRAGFPSPAEGYLQRPIDLNELMVGHQEARSQSCSGPSERTTLDPHAPLV